MNYPNGQIPLNKLTAIKPHGWLMADAADSYNRLRKKLPWLQPTSAGDAYRNYERQENVFKQRYKPQQIGNGPFNDVRWWRGVRYVRVTGAAAAVPGTSNHGKGRTVDFGGLGGYGGARFKEFAAIAGDYGWNNNEGRSINESWHWTYVPENDKRKTVTPKKGWYHVWRATGNTGRATTYNAKGQVTGSVPIGYNMLIRSWVEIGDTLYGKDARGRLIRYSRIRKGRRK